LHYLLHYSLYIITLNDTLVKPPWTKDQPVAKTSTWQFNIYNRQIAMPPAEFEPEIPGSEQLQTHALVSAATDIGPINQ
jgi:hypothetical protein